MTILPKMSETAEILNGEILRVCEFITWRESFVFGEKTHGRVDEAFSLLSRENFRPNSALWQ